EVLKSLYTQSAPSGTDCSGISRSDERRVGKAGTSSGTSAGNDLGNYTTGSVSGVKFEDHNANGVKNVGDQGLANWTIKVYTDAATPVFVASTTTDANGAYSFDLQPGDYLVCEVLKSLYTQSAPSGTDCSGISGVAAGGFKLTVTSSGTSAGNVFGNCTPRSVSRVEFDAHVCNCVQNVGDQGLANWTIKVYTDAATPVFVAST